MSSFRFAAALLVPLAVGALSAPSRAEDRARVVVDEENDYFASHDDRHFTQGIAFGYLSAPVAANSDLNVPFDVVSGHLPILRGEGKRKYQVVVGQSLFTPTDTAAAVPDPKDRPYAGWLYTGASLLQDHDGAGLENLEVLVGVVGPSALGKQTQNDFHQVIDIGTAHGWSYQLQDEPGIVASYERKWRFSLPVAGPVGFDLIPELGASLGNVFTYGQGGAMLRFGQNLGADYGPMRIRPSLSGTTWFDSDRLQGDFGWYVFGGAQARAVGRNIFLDGNSFENGPAVDKKPVVTDLVWGVSAFWSDRVRADFSVTQRSREFYGQASPDRFGMLSLHLALW